MFRFSGIRKISVLMVILLSVLLAACAAPAPLPETGSNNPKETPTPVEPVFGYEELVAALQAAGAEVAPGDILPDSFFDESAVILHVNGQDIQVFEFDHEEAQGAAAETISGNGFIIGTTAVDWISIPNFFAKGKLIVLYVGRDPATIDLLRQVMGEPLTGERPAQVTGEVESGSAGELVDQLVSAGAEVTPLRDVTGSPFMVDGQVYQLNGGEVEVFEYATRAEREALSETIGPSGSPVGGAMIKWSETPHIWAQDRLIVVYVGSDAAVIAPLTQVLGETITDVP